ncbi:hypothetical protein Q8791_27175 [Nocardiopsis sp. CT-R113]|uniref:Uncharacterized protein n=1 Tax=Nocardiopsis codii TaxID=3065942 RepID=A0ABU7KFA8_9ACTN|nr:hypothetical protein [Nocardiopsis sp. CT-R113]MEE2040908.1 hypothetical protein [Nocardiopsis sp. CT-R113]
MFIFLAVCMFGAAFWLNKKLKGRKGAGLIALVVALAGSMLLYRSPASQTMLGWADDLAVGPIAGWVSGVLGEPLPLSVVYGVLCIAGAAITVMDLWKDHTYNTWAIAALIVTPIAAHGAGSGALPRLIDGVHTFGAGVVAGVVGGAVGS